MLFDDRLATVLRFPAQSEAGARTQYRQLLDLLGTMPSGSAGGLIGAAYERLTDLAAALPPTEQAAILRTAGLRLRNRELLAWLAGSDNQTAAAALATAQLCPGDWVDLIPRLSVTTRGLLRHRRDLPPEALRALERLGVTDLVLPVPQPPPEPEHTPFELVEDAENHAENEEEEADVSALVRRIEAFQSTRRKTATAPRLPLGDTRPAAQERRSGAFDFATDAEGTITWADPAMAPLAVGLRLLQSGAAATVELEPAGAKAMRRRLPLRAAEVVVTGPAEINGPWRIDAAPAFSPQTGAFLGYNGRMRRAGLVAVVESTRSSSAAERMRQLLHELRTPVNAIQGFAELIQQQMFGHVPNEYRALAAAITVDAARLLAGFDEIDRLARLESGAAELVEGHCDLRDCLEILLQRLEGVLRPRGARIRLEAVGSEFGIGLEGPETQQLAWRLLATLAGALAPGEVIDMRLVSDGSSMTLSADLPLALLGDEDLFSATAPSQPRTISAGMFGTGFTLRLARAEALAVGGSLERRDDTLLLTAPVTNLSERNNQELGTTSGR